MKKEINESNDDTVNHLLVIVGTLMEYSVISACEHLIE
jgi:hypothetical protein